MQVTAASITLRKPDEKSKWLFKWKISADRNSVWEYVREAEEAGGRETHSVRSGVQNSSAR
jgi:hypothetical protein